MIPKQEHALLYLATPLQALAYVGTFVGDTVIGVETRFAGTIVRLRGGALGGSVGINVMVETTVDRTVETTSEITVSVAVVYVVSTRSVNGNTVVVSDTSNVVIVRVVVDG